MAYCTAQRFQALRAEYGLLCGYNVTLQWLARDLRMSLRRLQRYESKKYRPRDHERVPLVVQLAMLYLISEARAGRPLYQPPPRFTPKPRKMHACLERALLAEDPPRRYGGGRPKRINKDAPAETLVEQA